MRNPVRATLFLGGAALLAAVTAPPPIASASKLVLLVLGVGTLAVLGIRRFSDATTPREVRSVLMLVTVSTTLAVVASEFAVRFVYRDVTTTGDSRSYFSIRWRAGTVGERNSLGFREREVGPKSPGEYRIAVVGDSFTEGQGIPIEDRATELLQSRLNRIDGRRFEVLNFGRSGAASDDHLTILQDDVLATSPDFVLLQWFPNDLIAFDDTGTRAPFRLVPSDRLTTMLHRHSALFYFINTGWERLQARLGVIESYDDVVIREFGDPTAPAWSRVDEWVSEFVRMATEQDIGVGIVFFPRLEAVAGDTNRYSLGFVGDHIMASCERQGLQCLDLRPIFAPVDPVSSLWASRLDPHPGAAANVLATEAIDTEFGERWREAPQTDDG